MESQRIRHLTEGFLQGWLTFEYPNRTSELREEIVLSYIHDQALFKLLEHKLLIETVLRGTSNSRAKDLYDPIFEVSNSLVGLKLPSAVPKDTINKDKTELSQDDLAEW